MKKGQKGRKGSRTGLGKWSHEHRNDRKYRAAQAEGSRRHQAQLRRDARLGRAARELLAKFGEIFSELARAAEALDGE